MITVRTIDGTATPAVVEIYCASTETKPTANIGNGSKLQEVDTGKTYIFDATGAEWNEYSTGGGGTSDYDQLSNKPAINGEELSGDKPLTDFGILSEDEIDEKLEEKEPLHEIISINGNSGTLTEEQLAKLKTEPFNFRFLHGSYYLLHCVYKEPLQARYLSGIASGTTGSLRGLTVSLETGEWTVYNSAFAGYSNGIYSNMSREKIKDLSGGNAAVCDYLRIKFTADESPTNVSTDVFGVKIYNYNADTATVVVTSVSTPASDPNQWISAYNGSSWTTWKSCF